MAKPIGPLFSLGASGQIGKGLSFSQRRSGQMVRQYHKPNKRPSGLQIVQREIIAGLTAYWRTFTQQQKTAWNVLAAASGENITGFNLFVREANADLPNVYGLQLFLPFQEETGGQVRDRSGHNYLGTVYGSAPIIEGVVGKARQIVNTLSGYITIPDNDVLDLSTTNFTINFWIKPVLQGSTFGYYITKRAGGGSQGWGIVYGGTAQQYAELYPVGGTRRVCNYSPGVKFGQWSMWTLTVDRAGFMRTYINGVNKASTSIASDVGKTLGTVYEMSIGANGQAGAASFDDIRIYNRILAISEIKALFNLQGKFVQ